MEQKELAKEQKTERKDLLKYYEYVYSCSKCGTMYGTLLKERIIICPICYNKLRGKKKK